MLVGRTAWLAEAIVGEGLLGPGDMRHQPLKDGAAGFIGIEAEIEVVMQIAATLRSTEPNRVVDPAGEGIGVPCGIGGLVAKKRNDVAGGGEADAHHLGVFGGVNELVDRSSVETSPSPEFGFGAGWCRAWIGLALAHADFRMRRIEVCGGIAQRRAGGIVHVVEDEILARETSHIW